MEPVRGVQLDEATRCAHYHGPLDIVAIRFPCCGTYFACHACHAALADHPAARWPSAAHDHRAVRCGHCASELTIAQYLGCGDRCPVCTAPFNPRCHTHHHYYFELPS
jgi:uncharacterized CHY-type Zn-finger protein